MLVIVPHMFIHDPYADYEYFVLSYVFTCNLDEFPQRGDYGNESPTRNPIVWWLRCLSFQTTGYPNAFLMPFSALILPLVYYLGYYLTNDRLIGTMSMFAMIFNPYYYNWTTTGTYDQIWAFLLLLSIVLIYKSTGKSFVSYLIAILAKTNALLYFPLWLYSVKVIKNDWETITLSFCIIALLATGVIYFGYAEKAIGNSIGFFPENLEKAAVRNISLFWPIIPLLLGLLVWNNAFKAKNPPGNKKLVAVWIIAIFVMTPLIHIFTNQLTFPYRYVPLAAFISILISQVIVETGTFRKENLERLRRVSL